MKSDFIIDKKGEEVIIKFLEKYFYSKIESKLISYERIKNIEEQFKGIDVRFNTKKGNYIVDEKAAIKYSTGLETFAFEISYKKRWCNKRRVVL